MFKFNDKEYSSKCSVVREMFQNGKGRAEIAKLLGITYQTVHAVMRKEERLGNLKPMAKKESVNKSDKVNKTSLQ